MIYATEIFKILTGKAVFLTGKAVFHSGKAVFHTGKAVFHSIQYENLMK